MKVGHEGGEPGEGFLRGWEAGEVAGEGLAVQAGEQGALGVGEDGF